MKKKKNKKDDLSDALNQIEDQFGEGAIMRLNDKADNKIQVIPTGSLSLNIALGVGGIPRGRIVEIYGPEASGKTTLSLSAIAQVQLEGGIAAFIDAEHAFNASHAEKLGVQLDDLLISQPDTGEQALEITEMLVRSNAVDLIIVDSVAALTPKAEIEGDMGDSHMGLHARLMSQALRKITGVTSKSKTCIIFINQLRMKIGVMFGNPETTTGGNALKFYSSVRIDLRRIETLKKGEDIYGSRVRAKIVKNKVAPPFRTAEFEIHFDQGICYTADLIDIGIKKGVIERSGAWLSFAGEKLGQGRDNVRRMLESDAELQAAIESAIQAEK